MRMSGEVQINLSIYRYAGYIPHQSNSDLLVLLQAYHAFLAYVARERATE